jgi:hypothetical protein
MIGKSTVNSPSSWTARTAPPAARPIRARCANRRIGHGSAAVRSRSGSWPLRPIAATAMPAVSAKITGMGDHEPRARSHTPAVASSRAVNAAGTCRERA